MKEAIDLTARAEEWHHRLGHYSSARFTNTHYYQIVELAFLRLFMTWESFLEEAFVLYLQGKKGPSGYGPAKYVKPVDRQHAHELLLAEGHHVDWTAADIVIKRAMRFFRNGQPFGATIQPRVSLLNNLKTIRNAISHASIESKEKFKTFVRNELTFYPVGMTPGSFLMTLKSGLVPAQNYFAFYSENLQLMVKLIVPE